MSERLKYYLGVRSVNAFIQSIKRKLPEWDEETSEYTSAIGPTRRPGRPPKYLYDADVSSSNLKSIHYDKRTGVMTVQFHYQKAVYEYQDVPFKKYEGLKRAKSKGKYFHKYIRTTYPYMRVD